MNITRTNRRKLSDKDYEEIHVKNIVTGDTYVTCRALEKKFIDGVEFTQVLHQGKRKLIRSDSLKKVA